MNNILKIGRLNVIGDVILFLGKLCVSLSSSVFAFLMLDTHKYSSGHNKTSSPLFPVVVCLFYNHNVQSIYFYVLLFNFIAVDSKYSSIVLKLNNSSKPFCSHISLYFGVWTI
jgi:hypothetical protein